MCYLVICGLNGGFGAWKAKELAQLLSLSFNFFHSLPPVSTDWHMYPHMHTVSHPQAVKIQAKDDCESARISSRRKGLAVQREASPDSQFISVCQNKCLSV